MATLPLLLNLLEGLAQGTRLNNTADIYFDYNAAVVTNTTVNTIDYKLSVEDLQNNVNITLMPNPFKDYTTIRVEGANNTTNCVYLICWDR